MEEDDKVKRARERVRRIKGFYSNVITFFLVNILLLVVNLVTNPYNLWFYWVTLIWGVVLIIQAINIFTIRDRFLGEEWEERKTRELLDKENKNKPS